MYKFYGVLGILLIWSMFVSAQLGDITGVTLTFTPEAGTPVVATATDNGSGLTPDAGIVLMESTTYTLVVTLQDGTTDITNEVSGNADNYLFFFQPTGSVLSGDVMIMDTDSQELPLGLNSQLTTECTEDANVSGMLRVVLSDLTGTKSATSAIGDGTTVFDLNWDITIMDDPEAPPCENEEEIIDKVTLTFTPTGGGDPIVVVASDPDGPGPLDLEAEDIVLDESTEYELTLTLENTIEGEDITEEIREEDDEHMFFFAWTDAVFRSPDGDGNFDNRDDSVNYNDQDENGLPVGLSTNWTTECVEEALSGTFRLVLKHQPDIKSATSTADDGGTDLDLPFNISVTNDPEAPPCENEEEIIDKVTLTFTPTGGGDPIVVVASDPDGPGPLDLEAEDIVLDESTEYELTLTLENTIEGEDITEEIREEDDEHMFFFAWTDAVFRSPDGDGNFDNRDDSVNYNDQDENGLPVGLSTNWTTECVEEALSGTFRLVLKHQPDIKSATSTADDGGTDLDLPFNISVTNDPEAPPCENEEEIIDKVTLTFTPTGGGDPIVVVASDPDGPGPLDLEAEDIVLDESTEYELTLTLENTIEGEDITEEIREEDDEHMFFFAWTDAVFRSPDGDGNFDNRDDSVNYNDQDENGLPVGLSTNWTTECVEEALSGTFRLVLKHQPDIKSATSTADDGGTDLDLPFNISVTNDPEAPPCENEEEIIDKVTLTFTPTGGGDPIVVVASDPDGPGPLDLEAEDIVLDESTEYELTLTLENTIEGEDITEEIREEDDEHMFFFAWTDGIFSNPAGDGNFDNRDDAVNYNDQDENGQPVGLSTTWTTAASMDPGGTFRIVLKHQPDIKSATSTAEDGGTDLDLPFNINTVVTDIDDVFIKDPSRLKIFPNPVQEVLNWRLEESVTEELEVYLLDQMGRVLAVYDTPHPTISVNHLSKGTYILQVRSSSGIWTKRFIKL